MALAWYITSFLIEDIDSAINTERVYESFSGKDGGDDSEIPAPDEVAEIDDNEQFAGERHDAHRLLPHLAPINRSENWISWLRVVTATHKHAQILFESSMSRRHAPIKLHIIQPPIPSTALRPWPEVIRKLFPSHEAEKAIHRISVVMESKSKSLVEFRGAPPVSYTH